MSAWTAATGGKVSRFGVDFDGQPQLINWASRQMTVGKGYRFASAAIIESNSNLQGGTERNLTDAGAFMFCNMIVAIMRAQLEQGLRADPARPHKTFARRGAYDAATSVTAGGTLIDNFDDRANGGTIANKTAPAPISFDSLYRMSGSTKREFLNVVVPTAGLIEVTVSGYLRSGGVAEQEVELALVFNGVRSDAFIVSETLSATNNRPRGFFLQGLFQVDTPPDGITMPTVAVQIAKTGSNTGNNPRIGRIMGEIEFTPNSGTAPVPIVPYKV